MNGRRKFGPKYLASERDMSHEHVHNGRGVTDAYHCVTLSSLERLRLVQMLKPISLVVQLNNGI